MSIKDNITFNPDNSPKKIQPPNGWADVVFRYRHVDGKLYSQGLAFGPDNDVEHPEAKNEIKKLMDEMVTSVHNLRDGKSPNGIILS